MPHGAALDLPHTMNYHATCLLRSCYCTCTLPLIPAIYFYHLIYIIHRVYTGFSCTQNGKLSTGIFEVLNFYSKSENSKYRSTSLESLVCITYIIFDVSECYR